MDYEQALEWVHSLPRLAAHPGVENTRRLLEKLGNPEKSLRFVHVAVSYTHLAHAARGHGCIFP